MEKPIQLSVNIDKNPYLIISWNVDKYNDEIHNWLLSLIKSNNPDVIFLSETKSKQSYLEDYFNTLSDYNYIINSHTPAQWHGVAMLIRKSHKYKHIPINLNIDLRRDSKGNDAAVGRIIIITLNEEFIIIGTYVPNSGTNDITKFNYRVKTWDPSLINVLDLLNNKLPTMWVGDINVAPHENDVSDPRRMKDYAGYSLEERANFNSLIDTGNWFDVWRYFNPDTKLFTWLGYPHRPNYGMRLDNIIVSKDLLKFINTPFAINNSPASSDHIPVGCYVNKISPIL